MQEPIEVRGDGSDPEHEALLAYSFGLALLVVLDLLSPAERVAFVLHDMFGVPFEEIAPIVGRSPNAAKIARPVSFSHAGEVSSQNALTTIFRL